MIELEHFPIVFSWISTVVGVVLAILLVSKLSREERHPGSTIAWILAMVLIPWAGIPLYLVFGGRKVRRMAKRKRALNVKRPSRAWEVPEERTEIEKVLTADHMPAAQPGNEVEMIGDGVRAWELLVKWIEEAEETIHIGTFILARDRVGQEFVELLERRAKEGIEVRLLVDGLGSFWSKGKFLDGLRSAGGKVGEFMPVLPLYRKWAANLRLHRKIVVIDGRRAIIGGMNVERVYMGPEPWEKRWADYQIAIAGPSVHAIHETFAADWEFATGEPMESTIKEHYQTQIEGEGEVRMQIVASGPDLESDPFYEVLMTAIANSRERLWIVTPYLVLDNTLLKLLKIQCKLGRDVRIVVPRKSDLKLADISRKYSLRMLHRCGAKIHLYQKMVHSKLLVIDDHTCAEGSANMDMRSLYFNYEIAAFIYDQNKVSELSADIQQLIDHSVEFQIKPKKMRNWFGEKVENVLRLLSPLI